MTFKEFVTECERVQFELVSETESEKAFVVVVRTPIGLWSRRDVFTKRLLNDLGEAFARNEMTFHTVKAAYDKYLTEMFQD